MIRELLRKVGLARVYRGPACPARPPLVLNGTWLHFGAPCPRGEDSTYVHYHTRWWNWRLARAR